jgi:hypothetical protein
MRNVYWGATLCIPLKVSRRFGGTCNYRLQGLRISQARNQNEACNTLKRRLTFNGDTRRYIPEDRTRL